MKGIILAGGSGTRLYPVTRGVSKQLIPIYNKPMVYYPLATLMLSGVREFLIITTPQDQQSFINLFGDGSQFGLNISYAAQPRPEGLAQAFIIGKKFIGDGRVALALGDNIFYGHGLSEQLQAAALREDGATVFAYHVHDPERYGVVAFNAQGEPVEIVEKPVKPPSSYAVVGLYFYDNEVVNIAAELKPSPRGELEITDVNKEYLRRKKLHVEKIGRGCAWLDTGTYESLIQASMYVQAIEERQGLMVSCVEEIAYRSGYIDNKQLAKLAEGMIKNSYGQYLMRIVEEGELKTPYATTL